LVRMEKLVSEDSSLADYIREEGGSRGTTIRVERSLVKGIIEIEAAYL